MHVFRTLLFDRKRPAILQAIEPLANQSITVSLEQNVGASGGGRGLKTVVIPVSQAHIAKLSQYRCLEHTLQNCCNIGLSSTHCKTVIISVSRAHIAKLSQYRYLEHTLQNCRNIGLSSTHCSMYLRVQYCNSFAVDGRESDIVTVL